MNVKYDRDEIDKHLYRRNNHNIIGLLIEKRRYAREFHWHINTY